MKGPVARKIETKIVAAARKGKVMRKLAQEILDLDGEDKSLIAHLAEELARLVVAP